MTNKQRIKEVINSIESVKGRAIKAKRSGDLGNYRSLMGDLMALENCLVTEVKLMLDDSWEPSRKIVLDRKA